MSQTTNSNVYKNQPLILKLETYTDLSSASDVRITYRTPDQETGDWTATAEDTKVTYTIPGDTLDPIGTWYFQAKVKFTGQADYHLGKTAWITVLDDFEK